MSYEARKNEIAGLILRATILPGRREEARRACDGVLAHKDLFAAASAATTVHTAMLMALSIREMSGDVNCYLGNGQRLSMRTTIVPKGRGPFTGPSAFVDGCVDACRIDGLDKVALMLGWDATVACYEAEEYNGDGYRRRGIPSPYVFGATTVQRPGKFVADHVFDYSVMDPQLGVLAILETLAEMEPALAIPGLPAAKTPSDAPVEVARPGGPSVAIMQQMLNRLHVDGTPLAVDDSLGRRTRAAMNAFRQSKKLPPLQSPDAVTMRILIDEVDALGA